jgi:hypothetical protein
MRRSCKDLAEAYGQNGDFALEGYGLPGGALPERRFRLDAFIGNGRTGVRAGTVSKSQWET